MRDIDLIILGDYPAEVSTCSASTEFNPSFVCELAFDASGETEWASLGQGVGGWISVQFNKVQYRVGEPRSGRGRVDISTVQQGTVQSGRAKVRAWAGGYQYSSTRYSTEWATQGQGVGGWILVQLNKVQYRVGEPRSGRGRVDISTVQHGTVQSGRPRVRAWAGGYQYSSTRYSTECATQG